MQDAAGQGARNRGTSVQGPTRVDTARGVNTVAVVGVALTLDEQIALGVLLGEARDCRNKAVTDMYREHMMLAVDLLKRMLEAVDKANEGDCERCYVERARIVKLLNEQLLSEQVPTPSGRVLDDLGKARHAGYVAGWNDRARSLVKGLQQP
jgi:hypothetical protein